MFDTQMLFASETFRGVLVFIEVIMLLIGVLECFAGYKIRKIMVSVWGFFIGAAIGVAVGILTKNVAVGVIAALILGAAVAILAYKLYLVGIFLLAGSMCALAVYLFSKNWIATVIVGVLVGAFAVIIEKPTVIIATSVSGAATLAVSACLLMGIYNYSGMTTMYVLWIILSAAGIACQFITTSKKIRQRLAGQKKYVNSQTLTYSERKYPGMQRAYRNFCINCGYALSADDVKCPSCGFQITDE